MLLREVEQAFEAIDTAYVNAASITDMFAEIGVNDMRMDVRRIKGEAGETELIKLVIPGKKGRREGKGHAPTLGIIGRLGEVGARPERVGAVSDADGAIIALACGLKIAHMVNKGDSLDGDVIIATHICPHASIAPHDPVPFVKSPVAMKIINKYEVDKEMQAILSIDATKGNNVINNAGFAISPTVKEGYILPVSQDLLRIMSRVTGAPPVVFPISMQDITPYENDFYHLNSIMEPATATDSPVVGVGTTATVPIPGCATGANHILSLEAAARFCVEVAKEFGRGQCSFFNEQEFNRLVNIYGDMKKFQTPDGVSGKSDGQRRLNMEC